MLWIKKPKPIVLGRHLIELGVESGPKMGTLLKTLFEAQLEGEFECLEDGIDFARKQIGKL